MVTWSSKQYIAHYGILRRSGRYPWGSGDNPYQRSSDFFATVNKLKAEGLSDVDIAKMFDTPESPFNTSDLKAARAIAKNEIRATNIAQAQRLKEKGYSNTKIAERMGGINESTVRGYLAPGAADRANILNSTANMLRDQVEQKGAIDIGTGVELSPQLGVSRVRLNTAVKMLQQEGYNVQYVDVEQLGTGKRTKIKVLAPPGDRKEQWRELIKDPSLIGQIDDVHSDDGGRTFLGIKPPKNLDSSRIKVNYAEDGGDEADGVIYLRPGAEDLSLGSSRYAQVRIAVDGTHYLKGMAVYKQDLPDGVDVVFNTNKKRSDVESDFDTFKPLLDDPDNPFGASIKPGGQRGVLNIINEEGDWEGWSRNLATQFLSKQSDSLAKSQLDLTYDRKKRELEEILSLTNPVVKQSLLQAYADGADSASVHMKAANLPKQATHVILPVNSLKDNEIYAPNYENGERVALVRYPHGGIFEIPELVVNNKHPQAKQIIGERARDAVGINKRVADRLSGADFDGDTVLVIPNNRGEIKTAPALQGLKDFDPKSQYPGYPGMKVMNRTDYEMGDVSNLITDMTIRGAPPEDLAKAVRHSMVVIDAERHKLNYRQSARDNDIKRLKEKYQAQPDGSRGASTIISRASSPTRVVQRKPRPADEGGPIDKVTGKKVFVETGETYVNAKGETVRKLQPGTFPRLSLVDDAHTLSSGTTIEGIYADHSNRMKSLANQARREMVNTKLRPYSPSAREAYADEYESLRAKLNLAVSNRPRERAAQILANDIVKSKTEANPAMDADERKRLRNQALGEARVRAGAERSIIDITPNEWDAIQAGAVSSTMLREILTRADLDQVKKYATPRKPTVLTPVALGRIKALANAGYTQAEIAADLGISTGSVSEALG